MELGRTRAKAHGKGAGEEAAAVVGPDPEVLAILAGLRCLSCSKVRPIVWSSLCSVSLGHYLVQTLTGFKAVTLIFMPVLF